MVRTKNQNEAIQFNSLTQVLCELKAWEVSAHLNLSYSHSAQKEESVSRTENGQNSLSSLNRIQVSLLKNYL